MFLSSIKAGRLTSQHILKKTLSAGRTSAEVCKRSKISKKIDPNGTRTRVAAVKGRSPGPLDDGFNTQILRSLLYLFSWGKVKKVELLSEASVRNNNTANPRKFRLMRFLLKLTANHN